MLPSSPRCLVTPRAARTPSGGRRKAVDHSREEVGALHRRQRQGDRVDVGRHRSDNLAIKGAAEFHKGARQPHRHAQTEHKAVLDTCKRLEKEASRSRTCPWPPTGASRPRACARHDGQDDPLVDHAREQRDRDGEPGRRESGPSSRSGGFSSTSTPSRRRQIPSTSTPRARIFVSLSAHKMYGPGVGRAYVRRSRACASRR